MWKGQVRDALIIMPVLTEWSTASFYSFNIVNNAIRKRNNTRKKYGVFFFLKTLFCESLKNKYMIERTTIS